MVYFKEGTPEEWLLFRKKISRCIIGQNATVGPARYAFTIHLLDGGESPLENAEATKNAETHVMFKKCLDALMLDVPPPRPC